MNAIYSRARKMSKSTSIMNPSKLHGTRKLNTKFYSSSMNKASQATSLAFVNIFGLDSTTAGAVLFVSDGETSRSDEVQCPAASVG
jgi:hypothetical protein